MEEKEAYFHFRAKRKEPTIYDCRPPITLHDVHVLGTEVHFLCANITEIIC